jgi:hypothetical protein
MPRRRKKLTEKLGLRPRKESEPEREPTGAKDWDEMTEGERWAHLDRLMNLDRRPDAAPYASEPKAYELRREDGSTYRPGHGDDRELGPNDH